MPPPIAVFDRHSRVVSIGGMSKGYWGGLRIGWVRASAPMVQRLAAIRVGAELNLVDRDKFHSAIKWHGFHRAGEPPRLWRDDLLFAGDQSNESHALLGDHPVVIFSREESQGKADDAGGVGQQASHGEMRLARIGRT